MIRIYLFTYARDAPEAVVCVQCAQRALPEAVITVVDDEKDPVADSVRRQLEDAGAIYSQSSFPRNGNLRGPECVRGIIATLAKDIKEDDLVIKIDSDSLLLNGEWVYEMQLKKFVLWGAGYQNPKNPSERSVYGSCYALRGEAVHVANTTLQSMELPPLAPEDLSIARAVQEHFDQDRIRLDEPWSLKNPDSKWTAWNWWSRLVCPEKYQNFWMVTFGTLIPPQLPKGIRALKMKELYNYVFKS